MFLFTQVNCIDIKKNMSTPMHYGRWLYFGLDYGSYVYICRAQWLRGRVWDSHPNEPGSNPKQPV